jgi:hypothetical protein
MMKWKMGCPYGFPSVEERARKKLFDEVRSWTTSSKYFFFNNGLITRDQIKRYLMAQSPDVLEFISLRFSSDHKDRRKLIDSIVSKITIDRSFIEKRNNSITS